MPTVETHQKTKNKKDGTSLTEKELLLEIYHVSLKIQKLIVRQNIISVIKVVIIVLPFLFALWYLPPFFEKFMQQYAEVLREVQSLQYQE